MIFSSGWFSIDLFMVLVSIISVLVGLVWFSFNDFQFWLVQYWFIHGFNLVLIHSWFNDDLGIGFIFYSMVFIYFFSGTELMIKDFIFFQAMVFFWHLVQVLWLFLFQLNLLSIDSKWIFIYVLWIQLHSVSHTGVMFEFLVSNNNLDVFFKWLDFSIKDKVGVCYIWVVSVCP